MKVNIELSTEGLSNRQKAGIILLFDLVHLHAEVIEEVKQDLQQSAAEPAKVNRRKGHRKTPRAIMKEKRALIMQIFKDTDSHYTTAQMAARIKHPYNSTAGMLYELEKQKILGKTNGRRPKLYFYRGSGTQ